MKSLPSGQNVTGPGSIQRRYLDPVQGPAGYYGTVMMGAKKLWSRFA